MRKKERKPILSGLSAMISYTKPSCAYCGGQRDLPLRVKYLQTKSRMKMECRKDLTVRIYIDGKITTYTGCDRDFIVDLLQCPCCTGEEFSMTAWNEAFAGNPTTPKGFEGQERDDRKYKCSQDKGDGHLSVP